jgi:predicted PurR-regulated permease PerM
MVKWAGNMITPVVVSYLLAIIATPLVIHFHLLPTLFAGLAVHVLTVKLARRLPARWGGAAQKLALTVIILIVIGGMIGAGVGLWAFLHGNKGMAALLAALAETLENLKRNLPESLAAAIPATIEDLREEFVILLREHGHRISSAGMAGVKTFVHIIFGMVIGGMTALHSFKRDHEWPALLAAMHDRAMALADAFDKVVFAQVKISALNTALTFIFLVLLLPLFGIHLPLLTVLIPLTFLAGLLPVVGNLISNTAIVLISLGVSTGAGVASLLFLVLIHKLEYFTNARIVGGEVHASAWELICAMVTMEAFFGLPGLVAAPVAYAWLKGELRTKGLI